QFTGSALELTDALLFNPFAVDEMADAIHQALEMTPEERKRRMQRMRAAVRDNNVYRWAGKILSALLKVDTAEPPPPNRPPGAWPAPRAAEPGPRAGPFCRSSQ